MGKKQGRHQDKKKQEKLEEQEYQQKTNIGLGIVIFIIIGLLVYFGYSIYSQIISVYDHSQTTENQTRYSSDGDTLLCVDTNQKDTFSVNDGVKVIGAAAFAKCNNIRVVKLPNSLECILSGAFCGCTSLREINIPAIVRYVGDYPFLGVKKCTINSNNNRFKFIDHCFIDLKEKMILSYIGNDETIDQLPKDISIIGKKAFYNNQSIRKIKLGKSSITMIMEEAFGFCTSLQHIELPEYAEIIGNPFVGIHKNGLTSQENNRFLLSSQGLLIDKKKRNLIAYIGKSSTITLDDNELPIQQSLKSIGRDAFCDCCFIQTINTSGCNIEKIDDNAFGDCDNLKQLFNNIINN
ncbi:MAG: leucine-rich repeat protein [Bacteroidales bacterium]|nr:leucine-rich repeat protein [Bacteroidales bacterium]